MKQRKEHYNNTAFTLTTWLMTQIMKHYSCSHLEDVNVMLYWSAWGGEIAFVFSALHREVRGQLQHREAGSETVVVARGHFSRERLSAWWGFNLHPPAEVRYSSATQCSRTVRARTTKWKHFAGVDPRRPGHNKRWRRSYRSCRVTQLFVLL